MKQSLLLLIWFLGCVAEIEERHDNPLDRIFDDGEFRLVLNPPTRQNDGTYMIKWSNVFHREKGELSDKDFKLIGPSFLAGCTCLPNPTDLNHIKENKLAPSFTQNLYAITLKNSSYAGQHDLSYIPEGSVRSYVIYLNYLYLPTQKTGIMHSNVVVFKP